MLWEVANVSFVRLRLLEAVTVDYAVRRIHVCAGENVRKLHLKNRGPEVYYAYTSG